MLNVQCPVVGDFHLQVSITDVCLNEEMLRVGVAKLESIGEAEPENLTRSVPNIQQQTESDTLQSMSRSSSPSPELGKKRAESEPSIPHLVESELAALTSSDNQTNHTAI